MVTDPKQVTLDQVESLLSQHALTYRGGFYQDGKTFVLVGPNEPKFWDHFTQSTEYLDGKRDPLDRWSLRVGDDLALTLNASARFPFTGPPFHPFYQWALNTGSAGPSPVSLLVHQDVGLFISYRFALEFDHVLNLPTPKPLPCATCIDQPCRAACPVEAFDRGDYDVPRCKAYMMRDGNDCLRLGCAVRRACPIGQTRLPAQSKFHMKAFLK